MLVSLRTELIYIDTKAFWEILRGAEEHWKKLVAMVRGDSIYIHLYT